jgi:hypothetical protein
MSEPAPDTPLLAHWRGLLGVWIVPGALLGFGIAVWLVRVNHLAPPLSAHVGRIFVAVTGAVALIAGIAGAATALGAELLRRIAPGRVRVFAVHLALGAGFWPAWICLETSRLGAPPAVASLLRASMLACLVLVPPATYLAARRWAPRRPGLLGLSLATTGVALMGLAFLQLVIAMPGAPRPADASAGAAASPRSLAPAFESLPGGLVAEPPPGRLIVVAVDGLPPALLQRVIDAGDAPHLARLRREGAWGELASMRPTSSPLIWNSVATGRPPEEHGVLSFSTQRYPRLGIRGLVETGPLEFARPVLDRIDPLQRVPISSRSRKVKALWNLSSEAGISVGVVGWWASWPAEEVEGFVVSDHAYFQQRRMGKLVESRSSEAPSSYTWPPAALDALRIYQRDLDDTPPEVLDPFVRLEPGDRADFRERIAASNPDGRTLRWLSFSVLKDRFYARSALHLKQEFRPQVLMVYLQSVDQFAHLLWRYTVPEAATMGYDPRDLERYRHGMHRVVASVDDWIGQLIADRDEDTTVLVLSDHGWERMPDHDGRPTYGHEQEPPGVFVAAGLGIAPVGRVEGARILDIAPTLFYLLGLPISDELPGRILDEILDPARRAAAPPRSVASYEVGPPILRAPAVSDEDDAMIENLRALGYVE